jgi:hypothetical protein
MRFSIVIVSTVCFFAFGVQTRAQSATSPVTQALQSSLLAMLGKNSVQDVTINGSAESIAGSTDESGSTVFRATATGSSRIDLDFPSGTLISTRQISAGVPVGAWIRGSGTPQALVQHNLWSGNAWPFPAFTIEQMLGDPSMVVSYVGTEGSLLHFSAVEQPTGVPVAAAAVMGHLTQTDLWLDSTTQLPAKMAFFTHPDSNAALDIPVLVEFSNYQSLGGIVTPSHVQKLINNTLSLDLQIQSASINSGLTASVFTIQ